MREDASSLLIQCVPVGAAGLTCTMLFALLLYFGFCPATLAPWNDPVPSGGGMARMTDGLLEKGGPSLLDLFWSKLSDGRTSLLYLEGAKPPGRLGRDEARALEPSKLFSVHSSPDGLSS